MIVLLGILFGILLAPFWLLAFIVWGIAQICQELTREDEHGRYGEIR